MVKGTDTHRLIVLIALVLGSCSAPAASPSAFSVHAGDAGQFTLAAGRYRVAWSAPACTYLDVRWSPSAGDELVIPVTLPAGDVVVTLPAGSGYLNRAADCDYSIDVTPAG